MAAGAAVAAMPYLANLAGSVQASPAQAAPAQAVPTQAAKAAVTSTPGFAASLSNDIEPLVLVIKNDIVRGFKGLQEIKIQDQGLALSLKRAMSGRLP